jgi:hypothetical protein
MVADRTAKWRDIVGEERALGGGRLERLDAPRQLARRDRASATPERRGHHGEHG